MRVAQEFLALAYTIDQSFIGSRSILWQWTGTWQSLSEVTLAPGYNGRPILWQSLSPLRVIILGVCFVLCKLLSAVTVVQGFGRLYFGFDSYNIRTILGSLSVR